MCFGGGDSSGANAAAAAAQQQADLAAQQEKTRQGNITSGMDAINQGFAGFNDDFYNNISKAYQVLRQPAAQRSIHRRQKPAQLFARPRGIARQLGGRAPDRGASEAI
jgi:acetyl esterase/lipase